MTEQRVGSGASAPLPSLAGLRTLGKTYIVEPLYDPDRVGSIYLPDTARNPQAQQGIVVANGDDAEFALSSHLLFEPYHAEPFWYQNHEFLAVPDRIIIGNVENDFVYPRRNSVIVQPDFGPSGATTSVGSKIVRLTRVFDAPPVQTGLIVRTGIDVEDLLAGDRVILPPTSGHEIGLDSRYLKGVFYFLPADSILARLP